MFLERFKKTYGLKKENIGKGTYGEVYLTYDNYVMKKIKNLKPHIPTPETLQEINSLLLGRNCNQIITLIDVILNKNHTYLVFPLADGDLDKIKLPKEYIPNVFKQICLAVKYLHQNHITHCDLKPANILIKDGEIWLSDFGLVKLYSSCISSNPKRAIGTLGYRSIELLLGDESLSQSDIWSLGIILIELYLQYNPFSGYTKQECINIIFSRLINPFPNLSLTCLAELPEWSENIDTETKDSCWQLLEQNDIDQTTIDLIQKLLAIDKKERITIEEVLQHDYFKLPVQHNLTYLTLISPESEILSNLDSEQFEIKYDENNYCYPPKVKYLSKKYRTNFVYFLYKLKQQLNLNRLTLSYCLYLFDLIVFKMILKKEKLPLAAICALYLSCSIIEYNPCHISHCISFLNKEIDIKEISDMMRQILIILQFDLNYKPPYFYLHQLLLDHSSSIRSLCYDLLEIILIKRFWFTYEPRELAMLIFKIACNEHCNNPHILSLKCHLKDLLTQPHFDQNFSLSTPKDFILQSLFNITP